MNLNKNNFTADPLALIYEDDYPFLNQVLPKGLYFRQNYIEVGDKCVTTLIVSKFASYLDDMTFTRVCNLLNSACTLDITQCDKKDVAQALGRSIDELKSRQAVERSQANMYTNEAELEDTVNLQQSVLRSNEHIVSMTLRFIIAADTPEAMFEIVTWVKNQLEPLGIECSTPTFEMEGEYRSLQSPSDPVKQHMPVWETLSRQFPFYHEKHIDPRGVYLGCTSTNGIVIFNPFYYDQFRKSYDLLIIGKKGSGKSVTQKVLLQNMVAMGHRAFVLDVEDEYKGLAKNLGGKVIRPTDPRFIINPLQIRLSRIAAAEQDLESDDESFEAPDDSGNFASEISRITSFLYQYAPTMGVAEAEDFKDILMRVYAKFNITAETDLTTLKPTDFPVFSDVLKHIRDTIYSSYDPMNGGIPKEGISPSRAKRYSNLEIYITQLAEGAYQKTFNRHSTIDVQNEQFVVFDLSSISDMDKRVYNAYLFNILTLIWGEICENRQHNEGLSDWDKQYVICNIDEAHRFLNVENPEGLAFIEKLLRRSRKYDAALWFASQGILDFMPNSTGGLPDKIRTIFELVQYKFILQQDSASIPLMETVFPQLTPHERRAVPSFERGEMIILYGDAKDKTHCWCVVPGEDFSYFSGGG